MIRQIGSAPTALVALLALAIPGSALLAAAPPAAAEAVIHYTKETLPQYEGQLRGGQIRAVTVNKRTRSLRVTLKDGRHVVVKYEPETGPRYYAALKAKGIPVTFLTAEQAKREHKSKPVHHKLRYIAGGVLLAALVIIGAVLLINRRRPVAQD